MMTTIIIFISTFSSSSAVFIMYSYRIAIFKKILSIVLAIFVTSLFMKLYKQSNNTCQKIGKM